MLCPLLRSMRRMMQERCIVAAEMVRMISSMQKQITLAVQWKQLHARHNPIKFVRCMHAIAICAAHRACASCPGSRVSCPCWLR